MEKKTVKAWIYFNNRSTQKVWTWFCFPFLRVKMEGNTKTLKGARRAAKRTIERIGHKAKIEIL